MKFLTAGAAALALVAAGPGFAATGNKRAAAPAASGEALDTSKYFYFHRAGATLDEVKADYAECSELGEHVVNIEAGVATSEYMNLSRAMGYSPLAGALGAAIGMAIADALVKAPERRAMRRTNLRKCMGFKGYSRYPLAKAAWDKANDGDDKAAAYARMAELSVGSAPTAKALPL